MVDKYFSADQVISVGMLVVRKEEDEYYNIVDWGTRLLWIFYSFLL